MGKSILKFNVILFEMITEAFQAILKHVAPGQEDIGQNQSKACYKLYI